MKRFLAKIGRFFWSWAFLKFIVGSLVLTVVLVTVLYVEEDWRGAREWAATKAKWEARGVSLDPAHYFPPTIPDADNIAALSLFRQEPDPANKGIFIFPELDQALRKGADARQFLPTMPYKDAMDEIPDLAKLRADLRSFYIKVFSPASASDDPLAQLDAIYPFIAKLTQAAATRSQFHMPDNYDAPFPCAGSFGAVTSEIEIAKILQMHALLALDEKKSDIALADFRTLIKMTIGISQRPNLVSGLVARALSMMSTPVVSYGLMVRAWTDDQLAEMERLLARYDALANHQHAMRGEFVCFTMPSLEAIKRGYSVRPNGSDDDELLAYSTKFLDGWMDQNLLQIANAELGVAEATDPTTHRVFVDKAEKAMAAAAQNGWSRAAPWNILATVVTRPISKPTLPFVRTQVWIDEAEIACSLERYRLAHGVYPNSLAALAPTYIELVPCDPITGDAYHYRPQPDGNFLLYSVGWNQVDDGGKIAYKADSVAPMMDNEQGDWVWPTPK